MYVDVYVVTIMTTYATIMIGIRARSKLIRQIFFYTQTLILPGTTPHCTPRQPRMLFIQHDALVLTDMEASFQDKYVRDLELLTMCYDLLSYLAQSYARSISVGLILVKARTTVVAELVKLLAVADLATFHNIIKIMTATAEQVIPV
jgi:hypothetical protein